MTIEPPTIKRLGLKPGEKSISTIIHNSENVTFNVKVTKADGTGSSFMNDLRNVLGESVMFHVKASKSTSPEQIDTLVSRDDIHTLDLSQCNIKYIGAET